MSFDLLSTNKKGTGPIMSRINAHMINSRLWNIYDRTEKILGNPSFIDWKLQYHDDVERILALFSWMDQETEFFRSELSKETLKMMETFVDRFLERIQGEQNYITGRGVHI